MIELTEEQAGLMCDKYCRFPYILDEAELEVICNNRPLNGDNDEKSK